MTMAQRVVWRRRALFAGLALLSLHIATYAAFTNPRLTRVRRATALVDSARGEAAKARRELAVERERVERLRANKADVERFFSEVVGSPRVEMVPDLLAIEEAALRAGLTINRRAYDHSSLNESPLVHLRTNLPVSGRYQQIVDFLSSLESSPRFIVVDQLSAQTGKGGNLDLAVQLSTYYRAEPDDVAWQALTSSR